MLSECAPGYSVKTTDHHHRVAFSGKLYPSLPIGPHGRKGPGTEIEAGHVRKLARHLGIEACARRVLPHIW